MSPEFKNTIKALVIAGILLIAGFVGGTAILNGVAGDNANRDRPWFVADTVTSTLQSQPVAAIAEDFTTIPSAELAQPASVALSELEAQMAGVYNNVSPSVVAISVTRNDGSSNLGGFGPNEIASSGSGFVIDIQGNIVTNYHVVEGADEIVVNFLDGTIVRAEAIGLDADSDIAVIQVDVPAERLSPITFGSEKDLVIGQMLVAIGSPFGQRWTMTSGIVSALDRDIRGLGQYSVGSVIQTDAAINPGNSGGPLLNLNGEVVGVNSQIISEERQNSGIGFAVPSTLVQRVAQELIATGIVEYSYLGITGGEIRLDLIEEFNLANNQRGLPIGSVQPNSPASAAGLRGISNSSVDIIVAVDNVPIVDFSSLIGFLAENTRPGDIVTATILRDGTLLELPITLASRPESVP